MLSNKKIVVTGGCGFIGSQVVEQLINKNNKILVIDNLEVAPLATVPPKGRARLLRKSINNVHERDIMDFYGAYWIHLAALPFIPESYKHPLRFYHTNVSGTINLCEIALRTSARRFIYISTDEVYSQAAKFKKLHEKSPLGPLSPYAHSKLAAESVVYSYGERGLKTVILRLFNSYGPRATHPYFIPEMIRQGLVSKEIKVGNLKTFRDFSFVMDTSEAIVLALEKKNINSEIINVGSGRKKQMSEVLDIIRELTGSKHKRIILDPSRLRPIWEDPQCLVANTSKAKNILNWEAKTTLEEGLKATILYYEKKILH